ncbi:terpene synthase family protein [Nonomuraea sp. KM90]|uniref:terpene synthase family protein n=1 Tax=Nonomuraea sp. KM90 TaxID=3457428 RepID=UPI003FCE6FF0
MQAGTEAWIGLFDVLNREQMDRFRRAAYGQLAARVYPFAEESLLQLASDWCGWLFAIDDAVYEGATDTAEAIWTTPAFLRALAGESGQLRGFAGALADIRARISEVSTGEQLVRWRTATVEYLYAQSWEAANRERRTVPTVADYVIMRRITGAMHTVYALIDITAQRPLPTAWWLDAQVRDIERAAVDAVVYDNDIISYSKEASSPNGMNNLVSVLMEHMGLSVAQALDQVVHMREEAVGQVVRIGHLLETEGDAAVSTFVHGLKTWISGALDYSLRSSRYHITSS